MTTERAAVLARPSVRVNRERCAGCQECLVRCPTGALHLRSDLWQVEADEDLCVGCRQCARTCPFGAIEVEGPLTVPPRTAPSPAHGEAALPDGESRPGFASLDEAKREAERCLLCPDPTCVLGCPAHNDIPGFLGHLAAGDLAAARAVLAATSVFPEICSRVCDHRLQCEGACSLGLAGGEPVAIGLLERFVADHAPAPIPRTVLRDGPEVLVVGGGPGGIAAAVRLAEAGARVDLVEKDAELGGVLRWGIPEFTLPRRCLDEALSRLARLPVRCRTGTTVRPEELVALGHVYDAVVLAAGAGESVRPRLPGLDLAGVEDATDFLRRAKEALAGAGRLRDLPTGSRLLVLGAGNTAMDVARSALRLGASVVCVDWVARRFADVRPDELAEAEREGVEVHFQRSVTRLDGRDGRVRYAHVVATRHTAKGRRPTVIPGSEERWAVDHVVLALGYRVARLAPALDLPRPKPRLAGRVPDRRILASGLLQSGSPVGALVLEREAMREDARRPVAPHVYACGDVLFGARTVVQAMAEGLAVADAILEAFGVPAFALAPSPAARADEPVDGRLLFGSE